MDYYGNHICVWCGYGNMAVMQVAHVDNDNSNDKPSNLVILCPTHHRELDLGLITTDMILARRKFVETNPKADWSILIGKTKEELSEIANRAVATRKRNELKK